VPQPRGQAVGALIILTLLALVPSGLQMADLLANGHRPDGLVRASYVYCTVAAPGAFVGSLTVGALDGYGLVQHGWTDTVGNDGHPISWRTADWIERAASAVGNVAIYWLLWFLLRSGVENPRRRRVAKAAITVWLVVAVPAAILGAMWMEL
jgi:hypothetical protein